MHTVSDFNMNIVKIVSIEGQERTQIWKASNSTEAYLIVCLSDDDTIDSIYVTWWSES